MYFPRVPFSLTPQLVVVLLVDPLVAWGFQGSWGSASGRWNLWGTSHGVLFAPWQMANHWKTIGKWWFFMGFNGIYYHQLIGFFGNNYRKIPWISGKISMVSCSDFPFSQPIDIMCNTGKCRKNRYSNGIIYHHIPQWSSIYLVNSTSRAKPVTEVSREGGESSQLHCLDISTLLCSHLYIIQISIVHVTEFRHLNVV